MAASRRDTAALPSIAHFHMSGDNETNDRHSESLLTAIREGDLTGIQSLVDQGANVNGCTATGMPIMRYSRDERVIALLIANGADIELPNRDGDRWLNLVAAANLDVVRTLLRFGADPNYKDHRGETPLMSAIAAGRNDIVTLLLEAGAQTQTMDNEGWTPLISAIVGGRREIVESLLRAGVDLEQRDAEGETPLAVAAEMENVWRRGIADLLLDHGADPNARKTSDGSAPLNCAAIHGSNELVQRLIELRADVNAQAEDGNTALSSAVLTGQGDTVKLLLNAGAQTNTLDNEGWTPLATAIVRGEREIVEDLLRAGVDVEQRGGQGDTPLTVAAWMECGWHRGIADLLLKHGADPNVTRTSDGSAPLHCAAFHGTDSVVLRLIEFGADANVRRNDGATPLDVAARAGHQSTAVILAEAMESTG